MGRTKGQLEKFDLRGLDRVDQLRILLRGKEGRAARFSELEEFEDGLERFLTDPNFGRGIAMEEALEMMESLSDYFQEVRWRIQTRIEEDAEFCSSATNEDRSHTPAPENLEIDILRELGELLRSAEERRQNSETAHESHSVEDPRMVAFKIYIGIERRLGRIPSRSEIDAEDKGGPRARAVSRAVERMGLRMTDERVRLYLERTLKPLRPLLLGRRTSRFTGLQISTALKNLRVKSPEADFVRSPLRSSSMDRLVRLITDDRIASIIADEYETISQSPSEKIKTSLGPEIIGIRIALGPLYLAIDGKKEIAELLEAFRALAQTWMRARGFGLDLAWVQPGKRPNYDVVLDVLTLSATIALGSRRCFETWVAETIRNPYLRGQMIRVSSHCWNPPTEMIKALVDLPTGIEKVFRIVECAGNTPSPDLESLMERDETFSGLVEFLEPFDSILKILDYGIAVSRAE